MHRHVLSWVFSRILSCEVSFEGVSHEDIDGDILTQLKDGFTPVKWVALEQTEDAGQAFRGLTRIYADRH